MYPPRCILSGLSEGGQDITAFRELPYLTFAIIIERVYNYKYENTGMRRGVFVAMAKNELVVHKSQIIPTDQHPAVVYIASLAEGSRRTMTTALENIAQVFGVGADRFDWTGIRYQHVQVIRNKLAEQYAPSTANRHMAALRGVLREAWKLGHITAEEYQRAISVDPVKGDRQMAGRYLDADIVGKLIDTCLSRDRLVDIRDAAIIGMLYVTGIRRDELISLDMKDYSNQTIRVIGKGNKERVVQINNQLHKLVLEWMVIRGDRPGPLFTPINKHVRLTTQAIYSMLKRRGKIVGIIELSPHDFRHTFISNLFDAGVDISTIADLAGHSDVETTRRYDRRPERTKRDAVQRLIIPGLK